MIFLEVTKIEVLERLRGLDYLKSMIEEHEKDIIEDLKSHYDKKFILDIIHNPGLSIKEKMNVFFKEEE